MTVQLFGFVPVLRCIPRYASGMPLRPGLSTIFLQGIRYNLPVNFPCRNLCSLNLIVAVILFVAGPIIIYLLSQKDKSGKKGYSNRSAMNLLYKKGTIHFYHYSFLGAHLLCNYLGLFLCFAVSLAALRGCRYARGYAQPFLQEI
jgi:hypothetical protein